MSSNVDALSAYVDSLLEDVAAAPVASPLQRCVVPQPATASPHAVQAVVAEPVPAATLPPAMDLATAAARMSSQDIAALFAPRAAASAVVVDVPVRWLSFRIGSQGYAVEVLNVQEVVRVPDIAPVTGSDRDTLGVMNLRGQIVQVICLCSHLGAAIEPATANSRVIVLEVDGQVLGVMVDAVTEVFGAAGNAMMDSGLSPGALPSAWFRGLLRRNGELVAALDGARLLEL